MWKTDIYKFCLYMLIKNIVHHVLAYTALFSSVTFNYIIWSSKYY